MCKVDSLSEQSISSYERYEVEQITDHRIKFHKKRGKLIEFNVKWKDYPESENTWEPWDRFIVDQPQQVKDYFISILTSKSNDKINKSA